jgi:hypothetical protein
LEQTLQFGPLNPSSHSHGLAILDIRLLVGKTAKDPHASSIIFTWFRTISITESIRTLAYSVCTIAIIQAWYSAAVEARTAVCWCGHKATNRGDERDQNNESGKTHRAATTGFDEKVFLPWSDISANAMVT